MKRRMIVAMTVMMSVLGAAGSAFAGPATDIVKTKQAALFALVRQPATPANDAKTQALFDEMLDYDGLAKASLGDEWEKRTDAEKKEFSDLLKRLVRNAYRNNLRKTATFTIDYLGEKPAGEGELVQTRATNEKNKREEPVEIDFKMVKVGDKWKIADIITEGSSLVRNYKNQFTRIVKRDGFPTLIEKMNKKLASGEVE